MHDTARLIVCLSAISKINLPKVQIKGYFFSPPNSEAHKLFKTSKPNWISSGSNFINQKESSTGNESAAVLMVCNPELKRTSLSYSSVSTLEQSGGEDKEIILQLIKSVILEARSLLSNICIYQYFKELHF